MRIESLLLLLFWIEYLLLKNPSILLQAGSSMWISGLLPTILVGRDHWITAAASLHCHCCVLSCKITFFLVKAMTLALDVPRIYWLALTTTRGTCFIIFNDSTALDWHPRFLIHLKNKQIDSALLKINGH